MQSKDDQDDFNVEGVRLPRPFQVRRLGHFGYNVRNFSACLDFYRNLLGFRISDSLDFRRYIEDPKVKESLDDQSGHFMRHSGDHHSFVLFDKRATDALAKQKYGISEININQITWQVNTLREVVNAESFFKARGISAIRSGRDTPGSNWHTYVSDPDGHTVEVYYGIEQVGWDGRSKPAAMYNRGFRETPSLPQICELTEVSNALDSGIDLGNGFFDPPPGEARYDVGGILLPRPFSVSSIGPVRLFVRDIDRATRFYDRELGLRITEIREIAGHRAIFMRAGAEHHSLALYDMALRDNLDVRQDTTSLSFGVRLGSYEQLTNAVHWLQTAGAKFAELPPDVSPGIRHNAFVLDPDGNLVELYCEMEQLGWDGNPRQPSLLPDTDFARWSKTISPQESTFLGPIFVGPML